MSLQAKIKVIASQKHFSI